MVSQVWIYESWYNLPPVLISHTLVSDIDFSSEDVFFSIIDIQNCIQLIYKWIINIKNNKLTS